GVLLAAVAADVLADFPKRCVFLVGLLPAVLVLWIRQAVPETAEWQGARDQTGPAQPGLVDLFRGPGRRTSILTMLVCALTLTAHWAFLFWLPAHLRNLPEVTSLPEADKTHLVNRAIYLLVGASIAGNFVAAAIARRLGYRRTIALLCVGYFASLVA